MKYFYILILIGLGIKLPAQVNLVPNHSFEQNDTCPDFPGQITRAGNWYSPTTGTPDYYNSCSTELYSSVPSNSVGYQYPRTGSAYCGIGVFYPPNDPREYIQCQLTNELIANKYYCVSFYISVGDKYVNYFIKNISALLSVNSVSNFSDFYPRLEYSPQITSDSIIQDSVSWRLVKGLYLGQGGEKYLTIGNFNTYDNTEYLQVNSISGWGTYIYLDDISVIEISDPTIKGNTNICDGDTAHLFAEGNASEFLWFEENNPDVLLSTSANLDISPTQTTTFILRTKVCNSELDNSVTINVCNDGQPFISLYPNPTSDILNVNLHNLIPTGKTLFVYNSLGQLIFTESVNSYTYTINTASLASGVYTIAVFDNKKYVAKEKFVVMH